MKSAERDMSDTVQQIKQRLSIVDVVSSYVKLQKAGKNYKAKSPFTNEKTPSFFVSPDRDMYYCFSSGRGGDIFTFVQEMEGLDFKGALKVLADRAGVTLQGYSPAYRDEKDRLYRLMEEAAQYYEEALHANPQALAYLAERGFAEITVRTWRLGYAHSGWRNLLNTFLDRGYSERELEKAGLVKQSDAAQARATSRQKKYYDRFRGRIMFPIADSAGRTIAFTGRTLPGTDAVEGEEAAKYLNSPDTMLFSKSHALHGYHLAKTAIRKFDFAIVVEGQADLLASHQAGFRNTVAVSGSALSDTQLALLKRLSHNLVLAFDADSAGVVSSGRSAELALVQGVNVKVAVLPPGVDPADLVRKGADEWKKVVRNACHIVDFYLDYLGRTVPEKRTLRLEVGKRVLPFIARIPNKIDQAHFVSTVSARLGMAEEPVWDELAKVIQAPEADARDTHVPAREAGKRSDSDEPLTPLEQRLMGIILWQRTLKSRDLDVKSLEKEVVAAIGAERFERCLAAARHKRNQLLFEVETLYENAHLLQSDVEEMLAHLRRSRLIEDREAVLEALRDAERARNTKKVKTLTHTYAHLTSELEKLAISQ